MGKKLHKYQESDPFVFHCPGCKHDHVISTDRWAWNGSYDRPTFTPSLITGAIRSGGIEIDIYRCHSFVTDGNIRFLSDCWHELKGQTVELPDWD